MQYLFSKIGMTVLESLSFTRTLYAFDFDGTLSKIVRVPADAKLTNATSILLRDLSKVSPVAVISGRSIRDLRQRIPFRPEYLIGNHGLEGWQDDRRALHSAHAVCRRWKSQLDGFTLGSGVEIEDKGYSLSIHYRRSRNKRNARSKIKTAVDDLTPPPRVLTGKAVVNLLSKDSPHKGVAILKLIEKTRAHHVFYIGDDDTDEDVFALNHERFTTVRVGKKVTSQARYFIQRQSEIDRLLRSILQYQLSAQESRSA